MSIFARFRAINENDKAALVRKLMQSSTPDFDFFYFIGLSVLMASLGLLANNTAIVIGSMLIAPLLYPILGVALGLVMSNPSVFGRSMLTLGKSFLVGVGIAMLATWLFGNGDIHLSEEIMLRTNYDLLHFLIAVAAGAAVAFALGQPEWSETLPGIAISVALIPPMAVVGIGLASFEMTVVAGSLVLLLINCVGILFSAMVTFSLMNLYEKQNIAESTIKREEERVEDEKKVIEELDNGFKKKK